MTGSEAMDEVSFEHTAGVPTRCLSRHQTLGGPTVGGLLTVLVNAGRSTDPPLAAPIRQLTGSSDVGQPGGWLPLR